MGGSSSTAAENSASEAPATNEGTAPIGTGCATVPIIYLQLTFIDPNDEFRYFPQGVPVKVVYGVDLNPNGTDTHQYHTAEDGKLQFPAWVNTPCRSVTLAFEWTNEVACILCEPYNNPPAEKTTRYVTVSSSITDPPMIAMAAAANSPPASPPQENERFFALPKTWKLLQADWHRRNSPPQAPLFTGNGSYTPANGRISQTVTPEADIGSADSPVEFVLDPHWKYMRFEYFDRYFGPTFGGSPPRNGHGKRISVPPIPMEGFRDNIDPAANVQPDTCSNWAIGPDWENLNQSLPWILTKDNAGALFPARTGHNTGLRFRTIQDADKRTFVVSESKTARSLSHVETASPPVAKPGAERLKYYDLPPVWKSKNYFTREKVSCPPGPGDYFGNLNADALTRADEKDTPLVFSLDDLVLTDQNLALLCPPADDRVAIFWHTFSDRYLLSSPPGAAVAGFDRLGMYKPGGNGDGHLYPYSNVQRPVRYYLSEYPDWTRLVSISGNLWDAFSERTAEGRDVVGARAAVRWTDVTVAPNAAPIGTNKGAPGGRTDKPFYSVQPYWRGAFVTHSDNPQPAATDQNEWAGAYAAPDPYYIGRFDMSHVRCTDWHGDEEVGTVMRNIRMGFSLATVATCPPLAGPYARNEDWAVEAVDGINARWNALDAYNPARAWIRPRAGDSPPLRSQIVTLVQYLSPPQVHYQISAVPPTSGSWMNSRGAGEFRVNSIRHDPGRPPNQDDWGGNRWAAPGRGLASAHEIGHGGSMPDEYPFSNPSRCENYKFLHIPANPYQMDTSATHNALMKSNGVIRPRYFWHTAEWFRSLPNMGGVNWKLEHGKYDDYHLPHYPHGGAGNRGRDFYTWPVRFNLRQRAVTDNHLFDSFLYFVGKEDYTTNVLPGPIDGILVVVLRMYFNLDVVPGGSRGPIASHIFNRVEASLNALNRRFKAQFQMSNPAQAETRFDRCLIQVVPALNLKGETKTNSAGAVTGRATWNEAASPHHLFVQFRAPGGTMSPPNTTWTANAPANANRIRIRWRTADWNAWNNAQRVAWANAVAPFIHDAGLRTLGLATAGGGAGGFNSPPSYIPIVRTVMDNAAPDPTIT